MTSRKPANIAVYSCLSEGITETKKTDLIIIEELINHITEGGESHRFIRKGKKSMDFIRK